MPFSADGEPLIGELSASISGEPTVSCGGGGSSSTGIYVISGLGGSGMMRGAMGGYLLAQSIAGDEREKIIAQYILSHVSPNRFWKFHGRSSQQAREGASACSTCALDASAP